MRTTLAIALFATLTVTAACKKDKKDGDSTGKPVAEESGGGGGGGAKSIPDLDAAAFYKDFNTLDGMAALDKYGDGVIVSGKVLRTIEEMDGGVTVWLDAGDGKWISLGFKDSGKAAKDKGLKEGDAVKAQCDVGGGDGESYVMNIDCDLKS